jgi:hypothetical protein
MVGDSSKGNGGWLIRNARRGTDLVGGGRKRNSEIAQQLPIGLLPFFSL